LLAVKQLELLATQVQVVVVVLVQSVLMLQVQVVRVINQLLVVMAVME
jgi:hypothetical protein